MSKPGAFADVEFVWTKADKGYYWTWVDKEDLSETYDLDTEKEVRVLAPLPATTGYVETSPLEDEPSLFLKFGELEPTEESILSFANEHGFLNDIDLYTYEANESDPESITGYSVQQLKTWENEIEDMSDSLDLWDLIKKQDNADLSKKIELVRNTGDEAFIFEKRYEKFLSISPKFGIPIPRHIQRRLLLGDLIIPAKFLIARKISNKLSRNQTLNRLRLNENNEIEGYRSPKSLLAAMWLQFYYYVTGLTDFKRCLICGELEDLSEHNVNWEKHKECAARERARKQYARKKEAAAKKAKPKAAKKAADKKTVRGGKR